MKSPLTSPIIFDILGILLIFVFLYLSPPLGSDPGAGWHLKTGEWIWNNKSFIYNDPFLWTTEGKSWVANQWLADLIFWLIYSFADWDALAAFCFILPLTAIVYLQGKLFWSIKNSVALTEVGLLNKTLPLLLFTLALLVAWVQWIIRPVIFSFSLFSLVFYLTFLFVNSEKKSVLKFNLLIVSIFTVWANLHSAFPLGLAVLLSVLCAAIYEKKFDLAKTFTISFILACAATLVNPYGINLYKNILELMGSSYFMNLNAEWHSPDFHEILFLPLAFSILVLLFKSTKDLPLWIKFLLCALVFLSFKSVRYISFLGVILPVVFAATFYSQKDFKFKSFNYRPLLYLFSIAAVFVLTFFTDYFEPRKFASDLINNQPLWQRLKQDRLKSDGKLINHPNFGGAIAFNLYPECRASLDDRNELNGELAYRQFFEQLEGLKVEKSRVKILPCKSSDKGQDVFDDVCLY